MNSLNRDGERKINQFKTILDQLLLRRRELEMSQGELGDMLGISHAAVSDMERGSTLMTLNRLKRWASCLKLRVNIELLNDTPNKNL